MPVGEVHATHARLGRVDLRTRRKNLELQAAKDTILVCRKRQVPPAPGNQAAGAITAGGSDPPPSEYMWFADGIDREPLALGGVFTADHLIPRYH
jgi:hypothetical protein